MATISWPSQMPAYPLLAQATLKAESGIIRTPMESGIARQRKRPGTPTSRMNVSWSMSGAQVALFKAWIVERVANGGAWFNLPLILDSESREFEVRFVADAQYRLHVNSAQVGQQRWIVSCEIEIKDTPAVSFDVSELLVDPGLEALLEMQTALSGTFLDPAFAEWESLFGA